MIVYADYIFISLLCCDFLYMIFVRFLQEKQPTNQTNKSKNPETQVIFPYKELARTLFPSKEQIA